MDTPSQSVFVRAVFSAGRIVTQSPTSRFVTTLKLNSRSHIHWRGADGDADVPIRAGALMTMIIYQQQNSACAVLSSVACPALITLFPHYLIKGTIFRKKTFLNIRSVF
jgi:hypothetical protein